MKEKMNNTELTDYAEKYIKPSAPILKMTTLK